jgi:hypothetical protein
MFNSSKLARILIFIDNFLSRSQQVSLAAHHLLARLPQKRNVCCDKCNLPWR